MHSTTPFFSLRRLGPRGLGLVLPLLLTPDARAQQWQWAQSAGPGAVSSIVADAAGNIYTTGPFSGTANFGSTQLVSAGQHDIFVAKYDPAGTVQWAVRVGGARDEYPTTLAVTPGGEVMLTGTFSSDTVAFGASTVRVMPGSAGVADMFVARLSAGGQWQWATSARSTTNEANPDLALDANGDAYLTGQFAGAELQFGDSVLVNSGTIGTNDAFIAKISRAGQWRWFRTLNGTGTELSAAVTVTGAQVYIGGRFTSAALTVAGTTLTNLGAADAFIARLDTAGRWQWARRFGGGGSEQVVDLTPGAEGAVYGAGYFSTTATFGGTTLSSLGGRDIFVARVDSTGACPWALRAGDSGFDLGFSISAGPAGEVYVGGVYSPPSAGFGTLSLPNAGAFDVFLARADQSPAGATWTWATRIGGARDESSASHYLAANGSLWLGGDYASSGLRIGGTALPPASANLSRMLLARYAPGAVGLAEAPLAAAFGLWPNPAHGPVQVQLPAGATTLEVLDAAGRVVYSDAQSATCNAPLRLTLPVGLYVVRCGGAARRLVVE